ncbi:ATP-binding cassette domain-containing protein, partial [Lactiplantibacillus plantarum]|uniref:ATP-binding cassette domain-containing protein n=1 Tax=Lactiplantibacillus plantarum TaxID=1590 RepID=UPI003C21172A
ASASRIQEVLNIEPKITDPDKATTLPATTEHTLEFDHVDYRYQSAEQLALAYIYSKAHSGQTVAIIGGTGSGKTTLVNLIPRFYDIESGSIKLDGTDVRQLKLADLHQAVSFVPQTATLFTGTIRENMQFGNEHATDDEIWHALE